MLGVPLRFGDHRCGVVAANIEECPENTIFAANHDDRLPGNLGSEKLSRLDHLMRPADRLPRLAEDTPPLQIRNPRIKIPRRRNRIRFGERRLIVVKRENLLNRLFHESFPFDVFQFHRELVARFSARRWLHEESSGIAECEFCFSPDRPDAEKVLGPILP